MNLPLNKKLTINFLSSINQQIVEFQNSTHTKNVGRLPTSLPAANNMFIYLPETVESQIMEFCGKLYTQFDKNSDTQIGFNSRFRHSLGHTLAELGDKPSDLELQAAFSALQKRINERIAYSHKDCQVSIGCRFLPNISPKSFEIGPVRIVEKTHWLQEQYENGLVDKHSVKRVLVRWDGNKRSARKNHKYEWEEELFFNLGDENSHISVFKSSEMSSDKAQALARWVTRLAVGALAVLWRNPRVVLTNFRIDQETSYFNQSTVLVQDRSLFGGVAIYGNSIGPTRDFTDWNKLVMENSGYFQYVGNLLQLMAGEKASVVDNSVTRRMLHALIWLEKGYREENDLLATAMFASSLDAVSGSAGIGEIRTTVAHLLNIQEETPIFSGQKISLKKFIKEIYHEARNKTFHGFGKQLIKDWTTTRMRSESLVRIVFLLQVERLSQDINLNTKEDMHFGVAYRAGEGTIDPATTRL